MVRPCEIRFSNLWFALDRRLALTIDRFPEMSIA